VVFRDRVLFQCTLDFQLGPMLDERGSMYVGRSLYTRLLIRWAKVNGGHATGMCLAPGQFIRMELLHYTSMPHLSSHVRLYRGHQYARMAWRH
jgi:hypothetical protein